MPVCPPTKPPVSGPSTCPTYCETDQPSRPRDERRASLRGAARALEWVIAAFKGDPQDVRSWPGLDPLAAHALAVADRADACSADADVGAEAPGGPYSRGRQEPAKKRGRSAPAGFLVGPPWRRHREEPRQRRRGDPEPPRLWPLDRHPPDFDPDCDPGGRMRGDFPVPFARPPRPTRIAGRAAACNVHRRPPSPSGGRCR